jgi:gp16 family phage-associated protein
MHMQTPPVTAHPAEPITVKSLRFGIDRARITAARRGFDRSGVSVSDWARERGFDIKLVHAILSGRRTCLRGQSHRIAVALGIKDGEA